MLIPNYQLLQASGACAKSPLQCTGWGRGGGRGRWRWEGVSACPEYWQRVTLHLGFTLMRSGKVLTSAGLLRVCGRLKQNQLHNCHTVSASLEFSRGLQTSTDKLTIKIDNEDSSSNTKQGNEINFSLCREEYGRWLSSTRPWQCV